MDSNTDASDVLSNGVNQPAPPAGHVSKVKETWQQHEDFALAQRLQSEEFNQHFDTNRSERRLVQGDLRLSKEEQRQEDQVAADYYERTRREREREDERVAVDMQRRMEMKELSAKRARERHDEMLAKRLQDMELSKNSPNQNHGVPVSPVPTAGLQGATQQQTNFHANSHQASSFAVANVGHNPFHNYQPMASQESYDQHGSGRVKKQPPPRPPPPRQNN